MKRIFLIGDPVAHSVSPEMHNAAFQALGIDSRYELLMTPQDSLVHAVQRLRMEDCVGANVTIPHKQAIIPHLDGVNDRARQIGAVNTIIKRNGRLIGENTDGEGFLQVLTDTQVLLQDSPAAILGAGGVARAVAFALAQAGVRSIALLNRTEARALHLATLVHMHFPDTELTVNQLHQLVHASIVVNATSVGMAPDVNASPWPRDVAFPSGAVAFDLVYRPRRTHFLLYAEESGARTIDGLAMLVHQGAAALQLWTQCDPPIQIMFRAAEQALARDPEHIF